MSSRKPRLVNPGTQILRQFRRFFQEAVEHFPIMVQIAPFACGGAAPGALSVRRMLVRAAMLGGYSRRTGRLALARWITIRIPTSLYANWMLSVTTPLGKSSRSSTCAAMDGNISPTIGRIVGATRLRTR